MKPTDKQRREVKRYINKWRPKLLLAEWFFHTNFAVEDEGTGTTASCRPDTIYLRSDIVIYPCYWKNTRKEREEIIVHELCHCITEELFQASWDLHCGKHVTTKHLNDMRERLTQRITNVAFEW